MGPLAQSVAESYETHVSGGPPGVWQRNSFWEFPLIIVVHRFFQKNLTIVVQEPRILSSKCYKPYIIDPLRVTSEGTLKALFCRNFIGIELLILLLILRLLIKNVVMTIMDIIVIVLIVIVLNIITSIIDAQYHVLRGKVWGLPKLRLENPSTREAQRIPGLGFRVPETRTYFSTPPKAPNPKEDL